MDTITAMMFVLCFSLFIKTKMLKTEIVDYCNKNLKVVNK